MSLFTYLCLSFGITLRGTGISQGKIAYSIFFPGIKDTVSRTLNNSTSILQRISSSHIISRGETFWVVGQHSSLLWPMLHFENISHISRESSQNIHPGFLSSDFGLKSWEIHAEKYPCITKCTAWRSPTNSISVSPAPQCRQGQYQPPEFPNALFIDLVNSSYGLTA